MEWNQALRRPFHSLKTSPEIFLPTPSFFMSKLQVLSFMFVLNGRRCPLPLNLMSFVLDVSKSCTLCPLSLTQSDIFVKYGHVLCT
ncbi:hypothetical protein Hanom_Chr03g00243961 [Helianthus anomalus]